MISKLPNMKKFFIVMLMCSGLGHIMAQSISPVPMPCVTATTDLNVVSSEEINSLLIYSSIGEIIYQRKQVNNNMIKVDISNFVNGIYLVKINDGDKGISKLIIKN